MREPDVELLAWEEQLRLDEISFRRQIAYLYANSSFFRAKLQVAGFKTPLDVGGLDGLLTIPLTEKSELRATCTQDQPIGSHMAVPMTNVARIFSTSGTTGTPSYIPLTARDFADWITISARTYATSGIEPAHRIVSTYNAGPFVAGAALAAFDRLGLCHIPMGSGNTERLIKVVRLLKPHAVALTPSYAHHLAEWAEEKGIALNECGVTRLLVAGEPGGGEAAMRRRLETAWGAKVTEAMGIGDIAASLWGECEAQCGMHLGGRGYVHAELIDPVTLRPVPLKDGATGELVLTHLRQQAAPLLRFRTRDHVEFWHSPCICGRTAPRVRCIGRTDDMLIVRGVNVFPSALREVINEFAPLVSGLILVSPTGPGVKQEPPLPLIVELSREKTSPTDLAKRIEERIRDVLVVRTQVKLVAWGTLERSDYKTKLLAKPKAG